MKHLYTSLFVLLIASAAFGQSYQPFVVEGAHWKLTDGRCDYCGSGVDYPQSTFFLWFKLEGDTVINSMTYKKLYESLSGTIEVVAGPGTPICTEWSKSGYVREDTSLRKVFIIANLTGDCGMVSTTDTLFIDFSIGMGDTSRMHMANPKATLVSGNICMNNPYAVDTVNNNGFQTYSRRTVHLSPAGNFNAVGYYIYEGIGPSYGLIGGPAATSNTTYSSSLLSYCVGPDSVCGVGAICGTTAIRDISSVPAIAVYPNPAADVVYIETNQLIKQVEVFDLTGHRIAAEKPEKNKVELNVSQFARGIYFCRIDLGTVIVTRKVAIN